MRNNDLPIVTDGNHPRSKLAIAWAELPESVKRAVMEMVRG
jgi:hypothetical protein